VPIEPTVLSWLAIAAGLVAVVAFSVAVIALRRADRRVGRATVPPRPRRRSKRSASPDLTGAGVEELRSEVEALRIEVGDALRHLAVVRYDAFGDMGGHLSWSLALLDDSGNGMALTSIHGRSDSRTYAKNIREWTCDQQLSPEEAEAVAFARGDPVR
jgi:Protein of unknown function (DUF4446)